MWWELLMEGTANAVYATIIALCRSSFQGFFSSGFYVVVFFGPFKHLFCERTCRFYFQRFGACKFNGFFDQVIADSLAAKRFVDLCMIDRYLIFARADIGHFGDPFAVLFDKKRAAFSVFFVLNI